MMMMMMIVLSEINRYHQMMNMKILMIQIQSPRVKVVDPSKENPIINAIDLLTKNPIVKAINLLTKSPMIRIQNPIMERIDLLKKNPMIQIQNLIKSFRQNLLKPVKTTMMVNHYLSSLNKVVNMNLPQCSMMMMTMMMKKKTSPHNGPLKKHVVNWHLQVKTMISLFFL